MTARDKEIWFPSKFYGWGWGFPVAWQGWVIMIGYLALIFAGIFFLLPERHALFWGLVIALTVIFVAICYAKGEKPRWRWGADRYPES